MIKLPGWYWTLVFALFALGVGLLMPSLLRHTQSTEQQLSEPTSEQTMTPFPSPTMAATEVAQAFTQEPNATATLTLLPPPTIEPPTSTPLPSATPTVTPTQSIYVDVQIEGIQGLASPTSESTSACEPNPDWSLEYTIQPNETLTSIANTFGTYAQTLAEANCLDDIDLVRAGQVILVPGTSLPEQPEFVCSAYTVLQPIDNAYGIPSTGQLVFNWEGPRAPRYLLRLYPPDYDFSTEDPDKYLDYTMDLRQNNTIDLTDIEDGGVWHWEVRPLNGDFVQVCPGSPLWSFNKEQYIAPTSTPTSMSPSF